MANDGGNDMSNAPKQPESSGAGDNKADEDYMNDMRGWLVTVAALFVSMAFQSAVQQPPHWMPDSDIWSLEINDLWTNRRRDRALRPDQRKRAARAFYYQLLNTLTFSTALTLMTLILVMPRRTPRQHWCRVKLVFCFLSFAIALNFIIGVTYDITAAVTLFVCMVIYATATIFFILYDVGPIRAKLDDLVQRCRGGHRPSSPAGTPPGTTQDRDDGNLPVGCE